MQEINDKTIKFVQVAHVLETIMSEKKHLSDWELFVAIYLHYHLFHDYHSIESFAEQLKIPEVKELKLNIALDKNDREQVEKIFKEKIESNDEFSPTERIFWFEIWMFLYFNPENAEKVIPEDLSIFDPETILLYFWETKNAEKTLELLNKGGLTEARFLSSLYMGDIENNLAEAIKYLSKNDALEILTKLEYVYRNGQDPQFFWATEQKLYSKLNEEELWDSVQFMHALGDTEEISIELLISLAEKKSWSKALALKTAAMLAARHNENALLINIYSKIYSIVKNPELKGALMLRCGFLSEYKLKRYDKAEEFYRKALQFKVRESLVQKSLLRIYLKRGAYGEIVELASKSAEPILSHAAPLIASVRLHDYKLAWDLSKNHSSPHIIRLAAVLQKWEELSEAYKDPQPPVPQTVADLTISLIDVIQGNFDSAVFMLELLKSDIPKVVYPALFYIFQLMEDAERFEQYGSETLKLLKNRRSRHVVLFTLANFFKFRDREKAAMYMGQYLEEGGSSRGLDINNMDWIEILISHPDTDPRWFKHIESQMEAVLPELEKTRKWDEVIAIYRIKQNLAEDKHQKIKYLLKIARICEDLGRDSEETISYYTEILKIDPENKNALDSLSRIYETNEDWDNYIQVIRLYMEVADDSYAKASLYFKYGSIMETQFNKEDEALKYYKTACEISPTSLPALHGIRDIYVKRENWNGVLNTLKMEASIWEDKKEKAGIYAQMGNILYEKLNKKQQAIRYLEAALALKKDLTSATKYLFRIYFDQKEWEKATKLAENFSSKTFSEGTIRSRAEFHHNVGIAFLHTDNHIEASKAFFSAIETDPDYLVPLRSFLKLFDKYHDLGEYSVYLDELEEIYEKNDNNEALALIKVARAKILLSVNEAQEALDLYVEAVNQLPCFMEATEGKAELLLYMGKEEEAYKTWESFVKKCKEHSHIQKAYLLMARFVDLQLGDSHRAMIILRKLLEHQHNHIEALYELSSLLYADEQIKEALVTTDRLVNIVNKENYKHKWKIITKAALIYEEVGDLQKVDTLLRNADVSELSSKDVINIAFILTGRGKFDSALSLINKYLKHHPKNKDWLNIHKSLILYIRGNKEDALDLLNEMIFSTEALELLVDIGRTRIKQGISDYLDTLLPLHFNDPAYLHILAKSIPPKENRRDRVRQIHSIFAPDDNIPYRAFPLLRNQALAGEQFRRKIGVLDTIGPVTQMWLALQDGLEARFPVDEPALAEARLAKGPELIGWQEIEATLGVSGELWITELETHNMLVMYENNTFQIVVKPDIFDFPISTIRFLLGRALESARSKFSLLLRLTQIQRKEIADIMYDMAVPPDERDEVSKKFLASLDRRAQKAVERITQATWDIFQEINILDWFNHIDLCLDKVGLMVSGDPIAAFQGSAYLINKYNMIKTDDALTNYSLAPRTEQLIISYISNEWDEYLADTKPMDVNTTR